MMDGQIATLNKASIYYMNSSILYTLGIQAIFSAQDISCSLTHINP